jgi:hypothetical protein
MGMPGDEMEQVAFTVPVALRHASDETLTALLKVGALSDRQHALRIHV